MQGTPCADSPFSKIDSIVKDEGISTGWWTKIPPTNEVSHFENL
jgi:hypothetical protein